MNTGVSSSLGSERSGGSTDLRESRVELQDGVEVVESLRGSTDGEVGCRSLVMSNVVRVVLFSRPRWEGLSACRAQDGRFQVGRKEEEGELCLPSLHRFPLFPSLPPFVERRDFLEESEYIPRASPNAFAASL